MEKLRNMLKGWSVHCAAFIVVLIGMSALCMVSCKAQLPLLIQTSDTSVIETAREIIRDTVVRVEADQATLKALLECDEKGQVLLRQILSYESGQRLKPPEINITPEGVLTATATADSLSIYLALKDRYERVETSREALQVQTVEVNRLNGWQKFRLWIGNIVLIVLPAWIFIKLKTKSLCPKL